MKPTFLELRHLRTLLALKETGSVSFENKDTSYTIYDKSGKLGINITYKGKTHQWVGNPKSRKGSIGKQLRVKLDNVVYQ